MRLGDHISRKGRKRGNASQLDKDVVSSHASRSTSGFEQRIGVAFEHRERHA